MSFTEILRELPNLLRQNVRSFANGWMDMIPRCLLKTFLNRSPLADDYSPGGVKPCAIPSRPRMLGSFLDLGRWLIPGLRRDARGSSCRRHRERKDRTSTELLPPNSVFAVS